MEIILGDAGKKFGAEWIFRNVNYTFKAGESYAILGKNGSGKSTFLQIISGNFLPSSGTINYNFKGVSVIPENIFHYLSLSAPYQEMIEDFTLDEMVKFHFSFKACLPGCKPEDIPRMVGFKPIRTKPIRSYSSGMKQRVKLILAIMSDVPLLLLDEPTMNLDKTGSEWYLGLINEFAGNRTVIVCSNLEQQETGFCRERILIEDYK